MGIALCHFALTAKEKALNVDLVQNDPMLIVNDGVEYIASYKLK